MTITKYFHIAKISMRNVFAYKADVFAHSLFIGLIIFIFINLWQVIFIDPNNAIEGFTLTMMIWYLVLTESIVTSFGRLVEDMGNEIQSGEIATKLTKPYNYLLFQYSQNISKSLFRFTTTFIVGALLTLYFVGPLNFSLTSIPFIIISVLAAITLHFCLMALISTSIFWLEEAKAIDFLYSKIVFIIGGMFFPLEIFPDWLASISAKLPFSYIAYFPAKLFVSFSLNDFFKVFLTQLFWIAVIITLNYVMYQFIISKIQIHGG
jgi:ABC-2 type transport system permease protein